MRARGRPEPDARAAPRCARSRRAAAEGAPRRAQLRRGLGSQKPLDEVILDYLAEKARERAPERTAGTAARKSRPSG
jgi:hypothetical protein